MDTPLNQQNNISQSHEPITPNRTIELSNQVFINKTYNYYSSDNLQDYLYGKYLQNNRIWNEPPDITKALQIGRLLGKGGYGEVYKVSEGNKKNTFAIKIPGAPLSVTKNYILNEIQKLTKLSKPGSEHVPKIQSGFFVLRNEKIPYYITNIFCPIEKIFPPLKASKPIEPVQTLELLYLVAKGLKYITANNIIHNDIKPQNIMFYGGVPLITDYGTARSYSEINEIEVERLKGRLHGTPVWLPPELISIVPQTYSKPRIYFNLGKVCQKTDVWGLGLILMKCLTGKSLFEDIPLKTYKMPDIFYDTYSQFYQNQLTARYKLSSLRFIQRLYDNYPFPKVKLDIPKIRDLIDFSQSMDHIINNRKKKKKDSRKTDFRSGKLFIAKIVMDKMKLIERTRSDFEIKEFFINALFHFFDMCTASLNNRIKIYQLVDTLEIIFPNLKNISKIEVAEKDSEKLF